MIAAFDVLEHIDDDGAASDAVALLSLLLPLMVASRLQARTYRSEAPFDAIDGLRRPRDLDAFLERIMAAERWLIRAGVSFPAGGSLLVVASRRAVDTVDLGLAA